MAFSARWNPNNGGWDIIGSVPVSGASDPVFVTPTITVGAYSAGDVIGGVLTFAGAAIDSGGGGILQSLIIIDKDNEKAALSLLVFKETPASALADNAAFAWGSGDYDRLIARIDVLSSDYKTFGGDAIVNLSGLSRVYECTATSLFVYLVAEATPSYSAANDLIIGLGFLKG